MTMTVACPSCEATFPVDPTKIPAGGVKARCSQCSAIIEVMPPAEDPVEEAPAAFDEAPAEQTAVETAPAAPEEPPAAVEEPVAEEEPVFDEPAAEPEFEAPVAAEPSFGEPPGEPSLDVPAVEEPPAAAPAGEQFTPPREVQSPFSGDAEVTDPVSSEGVDEFGEREISFGDDAAVGAPEVPAVEAVPETPAAPEPAVEPVAEAAPAAEPAPEPVGEPAPAAEPTPAAPAAAPIQFGRRSPEDKAKSLARSLVSDIIAYHPDKHRDAKAAGTLAQVFEEEVEKCWKEYKDQVDPGVAQNNRFFNEALNEILADGQPVFNVEG